MVAHHPIGRKLAIDILVAHVAVCKHVLVVPTGNTSEA